MDSCNVYINEKSAVGQFAENKTVEEAVLGLVACLSLFESCDPRLVKIRKYYCKAVYSSALAFGTSIQILPDKELKHRFRLALKDACDWGDSPLTEMGASYFHKGKDVSWTSMSEAYENHSPILVNFAKSPISEPAAVVAKKGVNALELFTCSDAASLLSILVSNGWRRREYDVTSSNPPIDEESILADTEVFEPTRYRYKGRTMYRRRGTNQLCYIDSKHPGTAAHIEVFDEVTKKAVCKLRINEDKEFRPLTKNERARRLWLDNE